MVSPNLELSMGSTFSSKTIKKPEMKPIGRWTRDARTVYISLKICLETNDDRAIDLSCRACGAGAWALGLDSRLGPSAFFPTSDNSSELGTKKDSHGYVRSHSLSASAIAPLCSSS